MKRRRPPTIADAPVAAAATGVKVGDTVRCYVMWADSLLIHHDSLVTIPIATVADVSQSYIEVAKQVLQEKVNLEPAPALKEFRRTDTSRSFYTRTTEKPAIRAAVADLSFNFAGAGIKGNDASGGHFWAPLAQLQIWLIQDANKAQFDESVIDDLRALSKTLGITTGVNENELRQLPAWATTAGANGATLFNPKDIKPLCKSSGVLTQDCMPRVVRDHIFSATDFSKYRRLAKRDKDPHLVLYRSLVEALHSPAVQGNAMKKFALVAKIRSLYPSRTLYIRDPSDNTIHARKVPNPYGALEYRERVTSFAAPSGPSKYDPEGLMNKRNIQLLNEIVPSQIIANKEMSTAILEALWFCSRKPTLGSDENCNILQLLGELREYKASKVQRSQGDQAKAVLEYTKWPSIKAMLENLRNKTTGPVPPLPPPPLPPQLPPEEAAATPFDPSTVKPTVPGGHVRPPPPPPLTTHVRIIPRALGGSGVRPLLPGRTLGVL